MLHSRSLVSDTADTALLHSRSLVSDTADTAPFHSRSLVSDTADTAPFHSHSLVSDTADTALFHSHSLVSDTADSALFHSLRESDAASAAPSGGALSVRARHCLLACAPRLHHHWEGGVLSTASVCIEYLTHLEYSISAPLKFTPAQRVWLSSITNCIPHITYISLDTRGVSACFTMRMQTAFLCVLAVVRLSAVESHT